MSSSCRPGGATRQPVGNGTASEVLSDNLGMDFLREALADGRPVRIFLVIDDGTRERPAIAVGAPL
ncbi:hypothetical protein tb265_40160 [Gemmatimonadetes bacterium T265]|nr:hypothetical protein tb265_40160 [Gemmatimonadetes bacterium T265]